MVYQDLRTIDARRCKDTDRYRACSSVAVPLKTEAPVAESIKKGSGIFPKTLTPTVMTLKMKKAYSTL